MFLVLCVFFGSSRLEEMKYLLMCAMLELDLTKAVIEAEAEVHEVQMQHL